MKKKDLENTDLGAIQLEDPNPQENRKQRAKKKKKGKAGKVIFGFLGVLILVLAAFIVTVKVVNPDADLSKFLPVIPRDKAVEFINEKIHGITTTTQPVAVTETPTEPTTEPTTQPEPVDVASAYLPIEEFAFDTAVQGNYMGNLVAGGKVGTDMTYIYHIAKGKGIYRFAPSTEGYARIYKTGDTLSSLNLRGEYLYFVDETDGKLYRLQKGSGSAEAIAEGVATAYVYDKEAYCVTADNRIFVMTLSDLKQTVVFDEPTPDAARLIGISLNHVFFTLTAGDGTMTYNMVPKTGGEVIQFRAESGSGKIVNPVMENGFLYFYEQQDDGSYNLCRQKFGSEKTVTLVEAVTALNPPIVDKNRLFYGETDGDRFNMKELNMNSKAVKTMLFTRGVSPENTLMLQHGGEYDFIIGKKNDTEKVYIGSSVDTGSANIMHFEDGNWSY